MSLHGPRHKPLGHQVSYSLNSFKRVNIEDYIGDYYRGY